MDKKQISEMKHRMMHRFLVKELPGCQVSYNGEIGIDNSVYFQGNVLLAETKTCSRVVNNGLKYETKRPVIGNKITLGRFTFKRHQQEKLVKEDGWYLFMVGTTVIFGVKARDVQLKENINTQQVSWVKLIEKSFPDWLRRFKADVYRI